MDRGNFSADIKQDQNSKESEFNSFVTEDGKQYRVPYRMVKKIVFSNLKKEELIDIPHAARLQYRLMLLDPILKAKVDFTKTRVIIIYNPRTADNYKEKISREELIDVLAKQGVHVSLENIEEADFDYYKNFYSYAYSPPAIRESAPYGYSREEWRKFRPEYEKKMAELDVEKKAKFRDWQETYLEGNPEIAPKIVEGYQPKGKPKRTFFDKLLGRKKEQKEKGFWFHGV